MSIYIDDFLLVLNIIKNLDKLKVTFLNIYSIKYFGKVKTIIGWQITRNLVPKTIKIDQLIFICDLIMKKNPSNLNINVLSIKAGSVIHILNINVYKKENLHTYQ